jgi:hypothetical protein
MPRKAACASALHFASTAELLAELKRRSLGCMLICVKAEEHGDAWYYGLKGSSILLGAMSAALSVKVSEKLVEQRCDGDGLQQH